MTHKNVNGTGSSLDFFITIDLNENGNVTFNAVNFYDWSFGVQRTIYIDGIMNSFIMSNSIFNNVKVGTSNKFFSTSFVNMLSITNWTFTSIDSTSKFDENNVIISIENLNLVNSMSSQIKDIFVQSSISFLKFDSVTGTLQSPINFSIANIVFINSTLNRDTSIISFGKLETAENIMYSFTNLTFKNISFNGNGDLIKFQHQFSTNFIIVSYSTFSGITGGDIYLEAANKNNPNMKTKVKLQSCTFSDINDNYNSLIVVKEGGELQIDNWAFTNISSYESGSVVFAGYQKALVTITSSNFTNNFAIIGGVFNVESESLILIDQWSITSNFAISSGVIQVSNNGLFQIFNSTISNNYAISSSVSAIVDTARESLIDESMIFSNNRITISSFLSEISSKWDKLCFLSNAFKNYILENPKLYSVSESSYVFSIILGKLILQNKVQIYDQNSIFETFESTLTTSDLTIFNISDAKSTITASSSLIYFKNVEISRVKTSSSSPFIRVAFDSKLEIDHLRYYNSEVTFLSAYSITVFANNLVYENCTSVDSSSPISFDQSKSLTFSNWTIKNVDAPNSNYILKVSNSNLQVNNASFENLMQPAAYFLKDTISNIVGLTINNCSRGLISESTSIGILSNSTISNSGSNNVNYGGAMYILNSNVTISNSNFMTNSASEGGAINFDCSELTFCYVSISNSSFIGNKAKKGGAISYSLYRPNLETNTFTGNQAVYGNNIGSYATQINILGNFNKTIKFSNVGSGIKYDTPFTIALYDHDEQVVVLDSVSQIVISGVNKNDKVEGANAVKVNEGIAVFNSIIFISNPGNTKIPFQLFSKAISPSKIKLLYGLEYSTKMLVDFRFWMPGERIASLSTNDTLNR